MPALPCRASMPRFHAALPRRASTPRFHAALLIAVTATCFAACPAQAQYLPDPGQPSSTTPYSGGQASFGSPSTPYPYTKTGSSYGGGGGGQATCTGPITAKFVWSGGSIPAPQTVIVTQTSSASWQVENASGACDDGLGDSPKLNTIAPHTPPNGTPWPLNSAVSSGTHYVAQAPGSGGGVTLMCSSSASVPAGNGAATCSTSYTASVSPVTISLGGATLVNGVDYLLTGQPLTVSLSAPPAGCTFSNYQWDIESANGGAIVGGYIAVQGEGATTAPSSLHNPSVTVYDGIQDTLTINVTATVTFPDGTTGSVSATAQVVVEQPTVSNADFNPTIVKSDNFATHPDDASSVYGALEKWSNIQVTMPPNFTGGAGCVVQKISSTSRVDDRHTGGSYTEQEEQSGGSWIPIPTPCLDTSFPYPFAGTYTLNNQTYYGWPISTTGTGNGGDSPMVQCDPSLIPGDTGGTDWYNSTGDDQFDDWIMYNPSASQSSPDIWGSVELIEGILFS
jgi:hypothetical protein